jgi:hypothetical protein
VDFVEVLLLTAQEMHGAGVEETLVSKTYVFSYSEFFLKSSKKVDIKRLRKKIYQGVCE